MVKANSRNLLDNEAFMMDLFVAIVNVMDLDPDIRKSWIDGFQNHKLANKEFVNESVDANFDTLVQGERKLLAKLKAQIPDNPTTAYEKAWLANITSDDAILKKL